MIASPTRPTSHRPNGWSISFEVYDEVLLDDFEPMAVRKAMTPRVP